MITIETAFNFFTPHRLITSKTQRSPAELGCDWALVCNWLAVWFVPDRILSLGFKLYKLSCGN